jgi:MscS family membrane protein
MNALLSLLLAADARPWFEPYLPASLVQYGPRGLRWWQWLAIPGLAAVAWLCGRVLGWITKRVLAPLFARTKTHWDDVLLQRLSGPLTAAWALVVGYALVPWLALSRLGERVVERGLHTTGLVVFFWAAVRGVVLAFQFLGSWPWATANPLAAGILPLGSQLARVAVIVIGAIAILTQLGYPVASLLAGLGIGGLALALAAQKTVENLFGSVSISVDQPCRVGDFVKAEGIMGNVESIGLRSTRIRTPDRTIVTIPNGKFADTRIENIAPRDRVRLYCVLPLVYATTAVQMRAVLAGVEAALSEQPKLHPEGLSVRFVNLGTSSLDVEVAAYFSIDWNEFTAVRQELFLRFMEVVEAAGSAFAYPTQTVMLEGTGQPEKDEGPVVKPGPRDGGGERDRTDDL